MKQAEIINSVNEMCIQSLSPDAFEMWEKVKEQLFNNRKSIKEEDEITSDKLFFHKERKVEKIVNDPLTEKELADLIDTHRPTEIIHPGYRDGIAFIVITQYLSDGSFMAFCVAEADKTPRSFTAETLYNYLKYQGLQECYINVEAHQ